MRKLLRVTPLLLVLASGSSSIAAVDVQPNPDGSTYTGLLVNGSPGTRYDIVILGDGFTAAEQGLFNTGAQDVVDALSAREPFASHLCGLNVWRVNVLSVDSGIDRPEEGITKNTALDCRYGNPSVDPTDPLRLITCESQDKAYEAAAHAPDCDSVLILINDTLFGGGASGTLATTAIYFDPASTLTHELGHAIAGLDDEYPCRLCDGTDDDRTWSGVDFPSPNLSIHADRTLVPWSDLIDPSTPVPTTVDQPEGVVGVWEGGYYHAKGIYRSQFLCHMRDTDAGFCAACRRALAGGLRTRCNLCEGSGLPPTVAFVCLHLGRLRALPAWTAPFVIRFPIPPPCGDCPDVRLEDLVRLRLDDLPGSGFEVRIRDRAGAIVAEATEASGSIDVSFQARRSTQLWGELITPAPTQGTLTFATQWFRNGVSEGSP